MKKKIKNRPGFTMIELIAVLVIVGLLFAVAAPNFLGKADKARVTTTRANLRILHQAVLQFKMDTGRYPEETDDEGLNALVTEPIDIIGWEPGGYLEFTEIPQDSWGRDFVYQLDPESGKPFVIISYGADGEPEGEGKYDADLYSTDAK